MEITDIIRIIVLVVVVMTIVYYIYQSIVQYRNKMNLSPWLIYGTKTAGSTTIVPSNQIPMSVDGKYGIEFSYAWWMYIRKIGDKYLHVFHKGDSNANPLQAPGVWIDKGTNSLTFNMNTFSAVKETCQIGNLPMNKWFHVTMVVMNKFIDIYVNGNLKKRCALKGLPKQNFGDVYIADQGGWDGFISQLRYFAYALPYYKIKQMVKAGPSQAACIDTGEAVPPYLAEDYWTNTGFPDFSGDLVGSKKAKSS